MKAIRRIQEVQYGVETKGDQVIIYTDRQGAEWMAQELPQNDGFTRELQKALA